MGRSGGPPRRAQEGSGWGVTWIGDRYCNIHGWNCPTTVPCQQYTPWNPPMPTLPVHDKAMQDQIDALAQRVKALEEKVDG